MPLGVRYASLAFGITLLSASTARAEVAAKLEYTVSESALGCPSEREFRDAVVGRLGHDPFVPESNRRLVVEVRVEVGELSATGALVEVDGGSSGLRRLTGKPSDCGEVVVGMALAVSLAMNPALGEAEAGETSSAPPPAEPESPPETKPREPVAVKAAPPAPRTSLVDDRAKSWDLPPSQRGDPELVGVIAHGTLGVGPGVGLGAVVFATGRRMPWSLSIEGRFDALSTGMPLERGSVSSTLYAAAIAPCRHFGPLLACGLGLLGAIRAESKDVSSPGADMGLYPALGGRVGAEWPVSESVIFQSRLDLLATLSPVHIELGESEIWTSPPVSGALGAGVLGVIP